MEATRAEEGISRKEYTAEPPSWADTLIENKHNRNSNFFKLMYANKERISGINEMLSGIFC
jgi:hypothetical protein